MYTIILWDLDNTLLNFNESERFAFDTCMEHAGLESTPELLATYSKINLSFWKRLERGEITKDYLLGHRFAAFFEAAGISGVDTERFATEYQHLLGSVYYYLDDSLSLVKKINDFRFPDGQRCHQFILSNGVARTQRSKLKLSCLGQYMEGNFISEEMGAEKPALKYFEGCFSQIPDFKKENAILIGDSLTSDMTGANNAGIDCCWYNPAGKEAPDSPVINHTIANLWDILPIIEQSYK